MAANPQANSQYETNKLPGFNKEPFDGKPIHFFDMLWFAQDAGSKQTAIVAVRCLGRKISWSSKISWFGKPRYLGNLDILPQIKISRR